MKISRSSRVVALCIALFSMLFMQLAVAAYACPGSMGSGSRPVAMNASMDQSDMTNCDGMDLEQRGLCHALAHGEATKQSPDNAQIPDAPPFIPGELIQALHLTENFSGYLVSPSAATSLTRSGAPPIAIRNCCFRI